MLRDSPEGGAAHSTLSPGGQNMKLTPTLLAAALTAGLTVAAQAQNPEMSQNRLSAQLSGAAEIPKAGSPEGSGTFNLTLKPEQEQICYELRVTNVESPTAAHIHQGEAGKAGPPVVTLKAPTDGQVKDCTQVSKDVIADLRANPDGYYVNVHNKEFPGGAVRGQLSEGTLGPMKKDPAKDPAKEQEHAPAGKDSTTGTR